jgi:hypothetical protein
MRNQRIGTNENSFDPAEYSRVGADAEGETQNREDREARSLQKHSRTEAEILQNSSAHLHTRCSRALSLICSRPPNSRTAALRASFGDMPAAMLRSVNASRCCCISAFISASRLCFRTSPSSRQNQAWNRGIIYEAARTRLIPAVIRDQCSFSAASCFRPAPVNR